MKVASWNVNSLRVRLPQVLDWLESSETDVLGVQETKTPDDQFPTEALEEAGYAVVFSGQKTYNGVALIARKALVDTLGPLEDIVTDFTDYEDPQRRLIMARLGPLRLINVYVPNGASIDSDKYVYKLDWLEQLRNTVAHELAAHADVLVMGDFNIAPTDADVHDPAAWEGQVLVSDKEREAYQRLLALGLSDTFRQQEQPPAVFSWWDYRAAGFRRNRGVRIDLILASESLASRLLRSTVDKTPRGWERPSDHAPTVAEFTL